MDGCWSPTGSLEICCTDFYGRMIYIAAGKDPQKYLSPYLREQYFNIDYMYNESLQYGDNGAVFVRQFTSNINTHAYIYGKSSSLRQQGGDEYWPNVEYKKSGPTELSDT